jgi:hypothetical protein
MKNTEREIMNHDQMSKGMSISSPTRRVGWIGLIALLGCVLCHSASAQNTERVLSRPTPTPKVEVEKKTNTDPTAIQAMMTGSLSGTVYFYARKDGGMILAPCIGNETFINLVNSNGKRIAQRRIIPGKQGDKNAVCHYEFKDVPAGTYTLETSLDSGDRSAGLGGLRELDMRPYIIMSMDSLTSHPYEISCTGGGSPCKDAHKTVTIVARKASVLDLSVKASSGPGGF